MEPNKTISVRLTDDVVVQLETLARFDGVAIAEEIRDGIALLLAAKKQDPAFRERVQTVLEDAKRLLAEIGEPDVAEALGPVSAKTKRRTKTHEIAAEAPALSTV
jgi:Arc/MetJ-type ribon-helix-helix transcriptional regulator